jgi:hypothetical protein
VDVLEGLSNHYERLLLHYLGKSRGQSEESLKNRFTNGLGIFPVISFSGFSAEKEFVKRMEIYK